VTTFRDVVKWKTQYQKRQWEAVAYENHEFTAALYEKKGNVATIILNRPDKRNALNDKMFADLLAGLHKANDDPGVRVVIIKGAGSNFSAGHDLSSPLGEESPPVHPDLKPNVRDFFNLERRRCAKYEDISRFPKPTIAQVHGTCIGAGGEIHAACDFTIAAEDAQFGVRGFGVAPIGVFGAPVSSWPSGSHKLSAGKTLPEISGREMAEMGAVNSAVPPEKLEEETARWAEALARLAPDSLAVTKEFINGVVDLTGEGIGWRSHFETHIAIQWIRFRSGEVNFYREKKEGGLKGFLKERKAHATPTSPESAAALKDRERGE
jgi:enoyl-CoA hydratase